MQNMQIVLQHALAYSYAFRLSIHVSSLVEFVLKTNFTGGRAHPLRKGGKTKGIYTAPGVREAVSCSLRSL